VVITFDDGHANNFLPGEILAEFGMPWSLLIPTAAVGRENSIWTTEPSLLLLYGHANRLEVLEKKINCTMRLFRFSNGDFNPDSAHDVRTAGYTLAFTTGPGIMNTGANLHPSPRIEPAKDPRKFTFRFWRP
jgi:hypothetical protein